MADEPKRAVLTDGSEVASTPQLFHARQNEVILRGVSRGAGYLERVPAVFRVEKWPHHEDAIAFVIAACCFFRWGQASDPKAFDVRFRTPPGTRFDDRWRRLHRIPRPRARDVVAVLELHDLVPHGPGCRYSVIPEAEPVQGLLVIPGGG